MELFSDIISSIGNGLSDVFGGGDNNQKKRQQQQSTPIPAPVNNSPVKLPAVFQAAQQQQNPLHPTNIGSTQAPQNPLATPAPAASAAPQIGTASYAPPAAHQSLFSHLLHGAADVGEGVAGVGAGVALGTLRAGEGLVQGTADLPSIATHLGTLGANKVGLISGNTRNDINNGVQNATNTVTAPINWLAKQTDNATGMLNHGNGDQTIAGRLIHDVYTPAQIAANVATVVPGVAALAGKAGEVGNAASKIADLGSETTAKVADDIEGVAGDKTPVESGTKDPNGVTNAPAGEKTAPPEKAPNAVETGIKAPSVPVEAPSVPVTASATPDTIPDYTSPHKNGKASVPGNSQARYSTGDPNLDSIVNDSIIAHKGTSATAGTRADALDQVGITSAQRAQIRSIATKNVNKDTGKISSSAVKQIEEVIKTPKTGVGPVRPGGPVVDKVTPLHEAVTPEPVTAAETPGQPTASEVPAITKTGDSGQDLQNVAGTVRNLLENGRHYSGGQPNLSNVLDLANSHLHSNNIVAKALNNRLATHLTDSEARNVRNAIETGSTQGLNDKESAVVKTLQENIETPSNATRTNLSNDYKAADNHFPQVRQTSVKDAAQGAARVKGVNGKLTTFNDLLNRNSRFSEGSSMGKFTNGKSTIVGDAKDLGLAAKKDGTFVNKAGKVYQYARATSQELENAGTKLQAPKDALSAYIRDTLNLKTRADAADYLIKNSDNLGLSNVQAPGKSEAVSIKGSDGTDHSFFTDKQTAEQVKNSGILGDFSKETNLPTKAWNALSSLIAQGTVLNPFAHGLNLATNAAVGSGERANGITGASTLLRSLKPIDEAQELRMSDAGVHFPTYGKDRVTAISRATGGLSKLNETAVAAIDKQVRAGMFDNLTKGGMSDKEAATTVNKWMGGRSVYKGDQANLGIFWGYFGRQVKNAGQLFTQAAKGHAGPLINAAIASGATYAADRGLKNATGNQGAYIHAPGVVGILNDAANTTKDLATSQYRNAVNPVVNHINPLVSQAAEQLLGVNNYGDKFANGGARVANLLGITPETNALNNNGHSLPEKALNTFGVYTPHIKGDMATNNPALAPMLNVKGAQNGSSVAFPKDFTGEQESNVANKLGNNYTSKSAAILGTQTQSQQQKQLAATTTLKKYGITDATDVENFSKLSPKDQGSYVDAVDTLNKAGTAISTSSVQDQLVKNGNVALAAGMNKAIPNSLPQDAKNTLETYSTLGSAGQKGVWLQNNNNAAEYYPSVIAQKQAEGALTTNDTDMNTAWSGSGGTLYVNAAVAQTNKQNNVPQSLVELYKNTTKAEFDGTSTTGVNVNATQQAALSQYAQQLAANGVTDKFGVANGTSGSGGSSGSSAYSLDKAAGIPDGTISESFVKPTSDPGVKAVNPLAFKSPTLLKYTPDTKSNPYVRSISVTKGVK